MSEVIAPHLVHGWEPDTPVGDTLLRRYVYNFAASNLAPAETMGGRVLRRDDVALADLGRPMALFNAATLLQPPDPVRFEDTLTAVEEFFGQQGRGQILLWSAWPTPDLHSRGWTLEGHPPLLIRPPAPLPPAARTPAVRVEEVRNATRLRDWEYVAVYGYPFRELQPLRPGCFMDPRVLDEDRLRMWVGYDGDAPVAIGTLFIDAGIANFELGVTLREARGRGAWEAMARTRLLAVPDLPAAAVFSDLSRPLAERIGFLPITRFTLWRRAR